MANFDTVGKPHFRASIILCLLRKQAQMVPDQEDFPTVSTLVNDELIDIGFPKIRARSINRNNSSIPRFTKVGHEPDMGSRTRLVRGEAAGRRLHTLTGLRYSAQTVE